MTARVAAPRFFGRRMWEAPDLVGWEYASARAQLQVEIAEAAWGRLAYLGTIRWHGQQVGTIARAATPQAVADQLEGRVLGRLGELKTFTREGRK